MSYKLWTPEEESQLRSLVSTGKSYRQIGLIMGRSLASVTSHARQYLDINNNYIYHKYSYTHNFFAIPNALNCYVAGFLAADGGIRQVSSLSYVLKLEVSSHDEGHLNLLKQVLGFDGPTNKSKNKFTHTWSIVISNDDAGHLAKNFGVVPSKTHRLTPPALVKPEHRLAYLAGLLDGDGCVHVSNKNLLGIGLVSASIAAVQWYESVVTSLNLPLLKNKTPRINRLKHANAYSLVYGGSRAVCLVQLIQELARRYDLPILKRKWDNERINSYIRNYYVKYPDFVFDPVAKFDELVAGPSPQSLPAS